MGKELDKAIGSLVGKVFVTATKAGAHKATKYWSEKEVVRVTQRLERGKIPRGKNISVSVAIGRPNYVERKFIKTAKRAGVKFPLGKIQLKFPPKRKAA